MYVLYQKKKQFALACKTGPSTSIQFTVSTAGSPNGQRGQLRHRPPRGPKTSYLSIWENFINCKFHPRICTIEVKYEPGWRLLILVPCPD